MEKFIPEVGTKLYLWTPCNNGMVAMVRNPYTVIGSKKGKVLIQSCKLIFNGPRYYDTLADDIQEDPNGQVRELNWAPKKGCWQVDEYHTGYPQVAVFGKWDYQPYLD